MGDGRFKKGNTAGGSRKGIPNKVTDDLRAMFLNVADSLHPDGAEAAMREWAKNPRNQGKYWEFIARMLPKTIDATIDDKSNLIQHQKDYIARMKNGGKDVSGADE
jgi:hypothetical protein